MTASLESILEPLIERVVRRVMGERPANDSYLTVAEYAKRWSLSISTVRHAISERRLEVTRVGRAVRIAADAQISQPGKRSRAARADLLLLRGGSVR